MGMKVSGLCGGRSAGSNEFIIDASQSNQEDIIRAKSAVKIQNSWKKKNNVKFHKFKRLLEIKQSLDVKSSNDNEFVSEDYMQSRISPKVLETENHLPAFNKEPELRQFQLCFQRQPLQLKDGSIYFGQWNSNGQKHGYGILVRNDGSKYEGFFFNDAIQGRGRYIEPQGNFYYEGKI